jgi:23S rRNA pseudouridine2605 synthase
MDNKKNFTRKPDRQGTSDGRYYGRPFKRNEDRPVVKRARRENEIETEGEKSEKRTIRKYSDEKRNSFGKPDYNKRPVRTRREEGKSTEGEKSETGTARKFSYEKRNSFNKPANFRKTEYDRKPLSTRQDDEKNVEGENFGAGTKRKFSYEKRDSFDKPKTGFGRRPVIKKAVKKIDDGLVRLNKIIATSGICSRREADVLITSGLISVNGKIITELGTKVSPEDDIRYNGERMKKERLVYILLNKPKDYITTIKDPYAKRTVLDLIKGACKERVYPVGRLDRNTTGVLLLTNDGDLSKKLSHPSYNRKKIYHVYLDKNLRGADIETLSAGIELEDGFIKADEINFVDPKDKKQIGVEIHSGRNRVVRRMFEHLGYKVDKLDRVYYSGLTKKGLQRGEWRFLTEQEIGMLKMGSYE